MLKLYNTLTRSKEEFIPQDISSKEVKIYTCGPTVYSAAHIGNMRAYIFMDNLRKVLKHNGYTLNHVMNITDVGHMTSDEDYGEDKMEKAARLSKKSPQEIANEYTKKFLDDLKSLNVELPEHVTPATEHIKDMENYVAKIMENGYAYETENGIYFDTSSLPSYGELSGVNLEKQKSGARIEVDKNKKNPLDFALWIKAPKEHIMKWDSRWGLCYPGWHIECSAMSYKYLGPIMDIHTGGVDHIPIHHENEIAQSKGANGCNPARFWMHVEFLQVDGGKMSKSLQNCYTISDLMEKQIEPLVYRYFTYTSHYRNKLNFTWDGINAAKIALGRLRALYNMHNNSNEDLSLEKVEELKKLKEKFYDALNDDLNFSSAMSVVWQIAKNTNYSKNYAKALLEMDEILSLDIDKVDANQENENKIAEKEELELPDEVKSLLEERRQAREKKDFAMSDIIRDKLLELGFKVIDTKDGQRIEK